MKIVFFGTSDFSVFALEELKKTGFTPTLAVTAPDKPKGRGLKLAPPPVKAWAEKNGVAFLQPKKLNDELYHKLKTDDYGLFVVASYGKILPKEILSVPKYGALNVHPSLLPLYRGASPVQSQIVDGVSETGVTVIKMDEEMDHGPIVTQKAAPMPKPLPNAEELEMLLARLGGKLLAETIPKWVAGNITPREQDHERATYTKKITKEDGLINPNDGDALKYRKFRAFSPWPGAYFFAERGGKKIRVKVTDAALEDDAFQIKKVIPEGKKETAYGAFRGGDITSDTTRAGTP